MRYISILFLLITLIACKDKPAVISNTTTGSPNEILVVTESNIWSNAVGDTVKKWFQKPQYGLPQPEPTFDMLSVPPNFYTGNLLHHRNTIVIRIADSITKPTLIFKEAPWARTQKYFQFNAPDYNSFYKLFDANKEKMMNVFLQAEQERLVRFNKKIPNQEIKSFFKKKYGLEFSFPEGYLINKSPENFVWASRETKTHSRGFVFFQKNYTDRKQFDFQAIAATINRELRQYIPGPLPGSYMALDTVIPWETEHYQYDDKHYAIKAKGLWNVVNDYMGGPFILNVVLDEKNNRILYTLGYVYNPEDKKRNMLRQVESILNTMEIK